MLLNWVDWLVYELFSLSVDSKVGPILHHFIYDSIKILLLMFVMLYVIAVLRTFLPHNKIKQWMGRRGMAGYIYACLFGAVTPFCSCSSVPIFFGFLKAGIPLGLAMTFLITSPLVDQYLVVLMLGYFGWKITVFYILSGMVMGSLAGMIIGRMKTESFLSADMISPQQENADDDIPVHFPGRLRYGWEETVMMIGKIWFWILAGVAVGAFIHNFVPQETLQGMIGKAGVFSVPIAALIGVPLYGSCVAVVPIAVVLFQKGMPLGTALAFMMAMTALSLPEAIMLKRVMKLRLILIFFGITTAGIILTGYLFNFLQTFLI
ncbi:MAG: permease [Candidatus Omnitrophica bacterium]|nr:permease [Candidatus Omnitrophota bacterium]